MNSGNGWERNEKRSKIFCRLSLEQGIQRHRCQKTQTPKRQGRGGSLLSFAHWSTVRRGCVSNFVYILTEFDMCLDPWTSVVWVKTMGIQILSHFTSAIWLHFQHSLSSSFINDAIVNDFTLLLSKYHLHLIWLTPRLKPSTALLAHVTALPTRYQSRHVES